MVKPGSEDAYCGAGRQGRRRSPLIACVLLFGTLLAACNNTPRPPDESPTDAPITGKVLERLDSTPYTYLRLKTPNGELWAALPASDLRIGKTVTITNGAVIENFDVKPLGRKLDKVVFGTLAAE